MVLRGARNALPVSSQRYLRTGEATCWHSACRWPHPSRGRTRSLRIMGLHQFE